MIISRFSTVILSEPYFYFNGNDSEDDDGGDDDSNVRILYGQIKFVILLKLVRKLLCSVLHSIYSSEHISLGTDK